MLEKINKIEKLLTRLVKKTGERTQINEIINESEEVITDTTVKRILKKHYKQLYWTT